MQPFADEQTVPTPGEVPGALVRLVIQRSGVQRGHIPGRIDRP